ncbi:MAG: copper resistance protein B [Pseudomonadota bacterium]|jgi:copper resistance protein B|nr:copper resistance protein B [Pseudomonadota bacterium]
MIRRTICFLPLFVLATPALAQERAASDAAEEPSTHRSQMNHGEPNHTRMDHAQMKRGEMDHSQMTAQPAQGDAPVPERPPPPEAYEGPVYAADEAVGSERMGASRLQVMRQVSGMPVGWFQSDRTEYRALEGADGYLWDIQGYYGGDYDKIWFKSEGEGTSGEDAEDAEIQALWSHAIAPWWDVQAGVRQDLTGSTRTHAVFGVQGLAPYRFEIDAAAFISDKGDLTGRIEAELDQRITQRLILQPRGEVNLSAQDSAELGIGAGVDTAELGLRLRYEFAREFAPYVGIEREWKIGGSADYARANGEEPSVTNYVVGVRFWF